MRASFLGSKRAESSREAREKNRNGQTSVGRTCATQGAIFSVVYFSRGILPKRKVGKRALLGDLGVLDGNQGSDQLWAELV